SCIRRARSNSSSTPSAPTKCCSAAIIRSTWAISIASRRCAPRNSRRRRRTLCWAAARGACYAMTDLDLIRTQRLRATLHATAAAHPFYRSRFRDLGINPDGIRSLDDLQVLPTTNKDDYIANPDGFRLRPGNLPFECTAEERVLWDVAYTTGTTSG